MAEFIIIAALVAGISALIIAIIALFLALRASGSQAKKKPSVRSSSANAYVEELKRQQSKGGVNETPEPAKPLQTQTVTPEIAEYPSVVEAAGSQAKPMVTVRQVSHPIEEGKPVVQSAAALIAAPAVSHFAVEQNPTVAVSPVVTSAPAAARAPIVSPIGETDISSLAETSAGSVIVEAARLREATQLLPDADSLRVRGNGVGDNDRELVAQAQSLGKQPDSDYLEMMIVHPDKTEANSDTLQSLVGMSEFFKEADFPVETRKLMGIDDR